MLYHDIPSVLVYDEESAKDFKGYRAPSPGSSNAGAKITETINTILDMMLQKGDIREVNGMLLFNT